MHSPQTSSQKSSMGNVLGLGLSVFKHKLSEMPAEKSQRVVTSRAQVSRGLVLLPQGRLGCPRQHEGSLVQRLVMNQVCR